MEEGRARGKRGVEAEGGMKGEGRWDAESEARGLGLKTGRVDKMMSFWCMCKVAR